MRIELVRHGSTEPNQRGVLLGCRSDPGLTQEGLRQANAVAETVAARWAAGGMGDLPPSIVTSPLRRCRDTAERIASRLRVPADAVVAEPRLIEIDYGEWEGVALGEIPAESIRAWREDPDFRPPGGESLAEVSSRVGAWCAEQTGLGTLVAVTHVSPVKAAVIWALGGSPTLAWRLHVGVASITTVAVPDGGSPAVLGFNESGHLPAP